MNKLFVFCGQQSVDAVAKSEVGLDDMNSHQVLNYDEVQNTIRHLTQEIESLKSFLAVGTASTTTGSTSPGPRKAEGQLELTSRLVAEGGTRGEETPLSPARIIHKLSTRTRIPPPLEDVMQYGAEMDLPVNECHNFYDYWESVGWTRGRKRMKDWQASLRMWGRKWAEDNPKPARVQSPIADPQYRKYVMQLHNELRNDSGN